MEKKSHASVQSACNIFWSLSIFHPTCSKLHNQTLQGKNRETNYFLSSLSRSLSSPFTSLSLLVPLVSVVFYDCGVLPLITLTFFLFSSVYLSSSVICRALEMKTIFLVCLHMMVTIPNHISDLSINGLAAPNVCSIDWYSSGCTCM